MASQENSRPPEDAPAPPPPPREQPTRRTMRLVSFNVNGWPPTAENAAMSATSANAKSAAAAASSSKVAKDRATSAGLARWIGERLGADVLCLQETKISDDRLKGEFKKLGVLKGYESFWSCSKPPRTGYSGVATYCRSPPWSPTASYEGEEVLPAMHVFDHIPGGDAAVEALGLARASEASGNGPSLLSPPTFEGEGRFVEVELGDDLTVINVYAPNAGDREADGGVRAGVKVAFLRALRRRVDEILEISKKQGKNRGVVVCGDLNVTVSQDDVSLALTTGRRPEPMRFDDIYSREERAALAALMAPPMADAFRRLHPEATAARAPAWERGFTVWDQRTSARQRDEGLRIDFFLVSDNLRATRCEVVADRSVVPWPWSDHAALLLEIEVAEEEGGGGGAAAAAAAATAATAEAAAAAAPASSSPPPPPPSSSSRSLASTPLLVRPPPPHEPVPQSSLRHPRWQPDPRQPTLFSMFGKKRAADEAEAEAAAAKKTKE